MLHRAGGSSIEAAHIDSTFRLSVPLQAGDAFGDRRLLLLLIAVVRAARCFCARAAVDECGYSSRSLQPAEAEPCSLGSRDAEPQPSINRAVAEPPPSLSLRVLLCASVVLCVVLYVAIS